MEEPARVDDHVRAALLRHFVEQGRAPVAAELAPQVGLAPLEVEAAFHRLADAQVIVLAPGTPYVWMANPFSALPTPFRVEADGGTWWGNCIWDSLGIVALLGGSGSVTTWCPDCSEPLRVDVNDGTPQPAGYVAHYAVPAARCWDDIGCN